MSDRDKRRLKNSTLRAINIKQLTPNDQYDSVFHIFERLNTGGTSLKPQEIRNAVYRGKIVAELQELNSDEDWQSILGLKAPDRNQKDVELILRLFGLFEDWNLYEKPMLHFLNRTMADNREFNSQKAKRFERRFGIVTELVNNSLLRPFRPRGVINSAVLESVMTILLEDPSIDGKKLKANYAKLVKDAEFMLSTTGGTTDTLVLRSRINRASAILKQ